MMRYIRFFVTPPALRMSKNIVPGIGIHHASISPSIGGSMNSKSLKIQLALVISAISFTCKTDSQAAGESVPLYKVTVTQSAAKAINYEHLRGSTKIDM